MQQMQSAHNNTTDASTALAAELIEVASLVARELRTQMRSHRGAGISVPQFRAMGYVWRHPACALTSVAEHLGLSVGATSRLIDTLVEAGYIARETAASDRRYVALRITELGEHAQSAAREAALTSMVARLEPLSDAQRDIIAQALQPLRRAFNLDVTGDATDAHGPPERTNPRP